MKKILISLIMIVSLSFLAGAKDYIAPSKSSIAFIDTTTNDTYTIKSDKYNVYKTKSGAFYIWKVSKKTGKKYKYYLPKEIQKEMGRQYNEVKK